MTFYDELLMNEIIKLLVNTYLTSYQFWIIIILAIFLSVFKNKFFGFMGEFWVRYKLSFLSKEKYKVLNDIMIAIDGSSHQIDHIIVSIYGIFVVETKNFGGNVYGKEYLEKWIQYIGKEKNYFYNPIRQNYGHIQALKKLLNIDENKFYSIICFSNRTKLKVDAKVRVVNLDCLLPAIKEKNTVLFSIEEIDKIESFILESNITDRKLRKEHIKRLRNK